MEKQKAAVVKTPINVCVVSLGIVGADKMDKMTTYLKVVFIVNFSYLKRSVVYCHRICSGPRIWLQQPDGRAHPAGVGGGAAAGAGPGAELLLMILE